MVDTLTPEGRSKLMATVRQRDTKPEMVVRRVAHALGYRFRLQRKDLPGRPDIVFPKHRLAVFVNGCFWHRHEGCSKATTPKTRVEFWQDKFDANVARDAAAERKLLEMGWRVGVIWECRTRDRDALAADLTRMIEHR